MRYLLLHGPLREGHPGTRVHLDAPPDVPPGGRETHGGPSPRFRHRDFPGRPADRHRHGMGYPRESRRSGAEPGTGPPRRTHDPVPRIRRRERRDRPRGGDHGRQRGPTGPCGEGRKSPRGDPRPDDRPPHAGLHRLRERADRAGPAAVVLGLWRHHAAGAMRLANTPIPSISISTRSPGFRYRARSPRSSSQPPGIVPLPHTSPAWIGWDRERNSAISGNDQRARWPSRTHGFSWTSERYRSRSRSSLFTRTAIAWSRNSPNSSRVTMHGPRAFAQSFPGAGPMPVRLAVAWRSRAEKSLKIVTPKRWVLACAASMSRPP